MEIYPGWNFNPEIPVISFQPCPEWLDHLKSMPHFFLKCHVYIWIGGWLVLLLLSHPASVSDQLLFISRGNLQCTIREPHFSAGFEWIGVQRAE